MKRRIICFMLTLALLISFVPAQDTLADTVGTNTDVSTYTVKLSKEDKNWKKSGYSFTDSSMAYKKLDNSTIKMMFNLKSSKKGKITITYPAALIYNHEYLISTSKKFTKKTTKLYYPEAKNTKYSYDDKDEQYKITIKKLKSGKTYYIKFRNVEYNEQGKIYTSVTKWSKAKKIKVK